MTAALRYPANPLLPQGAYYLLAGTHPLVWITSWDGSSQIDLVGGDALADRFQAPECVQLTASPKGLIASWTTIDQQGANEDGVTFLDAANEPLEIDLPVRCVARDGVHLRKVVRDMWAAFDTKKTSILHWWTPEMGYWFTPVRLFKPPAEGHRIGGQHRTYETMLRLRGDLGFWQGLADVGEFRFAYDAVSDDFEVDYTERKDLGPDWAIHYQGRGGGYVYAAKGQARWRDDPARTFFTQGRTFVATRKGFESDTDYQVAEVDLGTMLEFGAAVDIWGRTGHAADGSWNGYGTRVRVTGATIQLHAFNNYHATHIETWLTAPAPLPREKLRVEFGDPDVDDGAGDPRVVRVRRGFVGAGVTALKARDDAGVGALGAAFRGVGFGGYAAGAVYTQGTPSAIRGFRAGDANAVTQSGFIERINVGTEPRFDRYTCYGPGTFEIAAGPGSTEMVKFGPLLPNQIMRLNSDGSKRRVSDFTRVPATPAELREYQDWLRDLNSHAPIESLGPQEANASLFGVVPPQGNVHRLIDGWFTRPIPAKSPGRPAEVHTVAVRISGGNANSRIVASGVPLRRYPQ